MAMSYPSDYMNNDYGYPGQAMSRKEYEYRMRMARQEQQEQQENRPAPTPEQPKHLNQKLLLTKGA